MVKRIYTINVYNLEYILTTFLILIKTKLKKSVCGGNHYVIYFESWCIEFYDVHSETVKEKIVSFVLNFSSKMTLDDRLFVFLFSWFS